MQHWSYKRVRVNDSWGPGAADSLRTPLARQAEFLMHPRHLRDMQGNPQLAHFTIDFPSGYLHDGWQGVHFTPLGADPDTGHRVGPSGRLRSRRARLTRSPPPCGR